MLYSKHLRTKLHDVASLLVIVALTILASCVPQASAPRVSDENNSTATGGSTSGNGNNTINYPEPTYTINGIFVQEGTVQTLSNFSLPVNFLDSFLVRGDALSKFLRTLPNTTKFCMVTKYTHVPGSDKFLILSAKSKSYTDLIKKTTEYYLQVEPSNDAANQNDCLTYNLTNALYASASNPSSSFSLTQLCSSCTSGVTSEGFKLYYNNGEAVPTLNLSSLALTIAGSTTNTGSSCVESSSCLARGYDCCLEGQCITDGAIRPGATLMPGFTEAQIDVSSNPNRFVLYPQYYFVCTTRPEEDGSEDNEEPIDPTYDAAMRLMEYKNYYNCLNKVDGEFSYCTVKFSNASTKIAAASPFSPAEQGFLDDINFQTLNPNFATGDYLNNIVKIYYGGQVLYESNVKPLDPADGNFISGSNNDSLTVAQSVKITRALPSNALDDNLYLTYKVDGTCTKISTSLAKCVKTYIHDATDTTSTSFHDATNVYKLPAYADLSSTANVIVKIGGVVVPEDTSTWTKGQSPNRITFNPSYTLYQNQQIEITYYVNSGVDDLLKSRNEAQTAVNTMCLCAASYNCNLNPIYTNNVITNYECIYPSSTSNEPPANQTVYVSSKNVPHRYYDSNGVAYDGDFATALDQEGTPFSYKNNDLLKPTNLDAYTGYTGFNEIYGSFAKTGTPARPAKMVRVKKDTVYDIYTNSGVFSTCLTCGSDYYSSLQKIFPQSFTGKGGGYSPDFYESRRENSLSAYRSDDLHYGRACFIPATMIPWTHSPSSSVTSQRRNRLAAQHFLFANGYNKDWFGFDYGSMIGSFDGITWFSIGNARRIKATTTKLFLAVNAYYGDLSIDSNFNVTVSETTTYSTAMPDHDTETDGAECQRAHFCSHDNDCFRQLGYDYVCQNVSGLMTIWPQSDSSGTEIIGGNMKSIASIVGGTNGQSKRCVYRGRGAPCHANLNAIGATFNNSGMIGSLACSPNNMCQPLSTGSNNRFNDRISRFANTPVAQNNSNAAPTASDTYGLGARIMGRPYEYYGNKTIPSGSGVGLAGNSVAAVCVPGKDPVSTTTTYELNSVAPANRIDSSDQIFGIGITTSAVQSSKYLNSCPATDAAGISIQHYSLNLGTAGINIPTITQNLSSNLVNLPALASQNIFSSVNDNQVTSVGYQKNSCLRAPGASCFSDMDCGPSTFIADKVKSVNLAGILNTAEQNFWKEELICGNPDFKYLQPGIKNPDFSIKKNTCCRDVGKVMTVYTQTATSDYHWCTNTTPGSGQVKVAGLNANIDSYNRYSRVHTAYDKMTCDINEVPTKSFALNITAGSFTQAYQQLQTQYKTLDAINSRTCCTNNWIRSFHSSNGGGHTWGQHKLQPFDKSIFRGINWMPDNDSFSAQPYECTIANYLTTNCEIRNISPAEKAVYLKFFGAFELAGIPQVPLMSSQHVTMTNNNLNTSYGIYSAQGAPVGTTAPAPAWSSTTANIKPMVPGVGSLDFIDNDSRARFSANNPLLTNIKKVFSDSEFNCCIPSGQEVPTTTTASQCCTGYLANQGASTLLRCCLPDYTDLTVYLSRYVSSEGRGLPDSAYDPDTGYIKDPGVVESMALQRGLCCSGKTSRGVAIRKLPIPLTGGTWVKQPDAYTTRFVYLNNAVDNNDDFGSVGDIFDAGVRWNDHVYCIPEDDFEVKPEL